MKYFMNCAAVLCVSIVFGLHSVAGPAYAFEDLPGPFWRDAAEIELRVVDRDGRAVAGAEVDVGTDYDSAYLKSGRPPYPDRTPNTDPQGVYRLILLASFTTVVITDDAGVAIIDPQALIDQQGPMEVQLQPWSRVTGQLIDAQGRPRAGEQVRLEIGHWVANQLNPLLDVYYVATTDAAGGFRFERVPPGVVRVNHYATTPVRGRSAVGRAEPGQELKLVVGGGGRSVRGLIPVEVLTDQAPGKPTGDVLIIPRGDEDWVFNNTPIPKPMDHPVWPLDKRRAWRETWNRSAQRLAFERKRAELSFTQLSFRQKGRVQSNGTFEVPDIPPGEYILQVYLPDQPYASFPFDLTGADPRSDAREDSPLDLGLLPLGVSLRVGVGDPLPDFEMTELPVSDPPVTRRFSHFKGRYVLLDAWATWCPPCLAESPNVQEVVKAFADDDRLVVLCISHDRSPDRPTHYMNAKSLGGIQTWMSSSQDKERITRFRYKGFPSIWLIDPDGKIIAQDLWGEDIMTAVAEALAADQSR